MGVTRAERRGINAAALARGGYFGGNRRHRGAGTRSSRFAAALGAKAEIRHSRSLCGASPAGKRLIEGAVAQIDPTSLETLRLRAQKP